MGFFITVEGADGAGKTTQLKLLEEYLLKRGYPVVVTREPGGTAIGERIRELILDKRHTEMEYMTELLLYVASRAQHVLEKIKPALAEGAVVLCDRFMDSNLCYQGYGRGIPLQTILELNQLAIGAFAPDLTFFLDLSAKDGLARKKIQKGHAADRMESAADAFHACVQEGFAALWKENPGRIKRIDASRPVMEIHNEMVRYLEELFGYEE